MVFITICFPGNMGLSIFIKQKGMTNSRNFFTTSWTQHLLFQIRYKARNVSTLNNMRLWVTVAGLGWVSAVIHAREHPERVCRTSLGSYKQRTICSHVIPCLQLIPSNLVSRILSIILDSDLQGYTEHGISNLQPWNPKLPFPHHLLCKFLFITEVCPLLVIGSPDLQHGAAKQVSSKIISSPGAFRKLLQFIQLIANTEKWHLLQSLPLLFFTFQCLWIFSPFIQQKQNWASFSYLWAAFICDK